MSSDLRHTNQSPKKDSWQPMSLSYIGRVGDVTLAKTVGTQDADFINGPKA
jgi:hypothetical protein